MRGTRSIIGAFSLAVLLTSHAHALTLTLAWDPAADPSVTGFVVSYGSQSGMYPNVLDVGSSTGAALSNLSERSPYYFVVQSYDSAGELSPPTPAAVYFPLTISCPVPSALSPDGNPTPVTFNAPVISGGTQPSAPTCNPASGTLFPVGTTPLVCSAYDVHGIVTCDSVVSVTAAVPIPSQPAGKPQPPSSAGNTPSATPPLYVIPAPPGSYGFTSNGYFKPDGTWQQTRLVRTTPPKPAPPPAPPARKKR